MMLLIALVGGLLACIFASVWAVSVADKVDSLDEQAVRAVRQLNNDIADLDKRLKEAHRLATKAQVEADNALNGVGALGLRFDAHRQALDAHKRLRRPNSR